ncbi:MAG: metallopeptidase family protein [Chloroflexia bacterium]|nr:metallopeptidase family protein [Chloroflexia bacterium]
MRRSAPARVAQFRRRRFERLVASALDDLPPTIARMLDNVEVVIEDEPTPEQAGPRPAAATADETVFGLYEGVPRSERGHAYSLVLPDKITIFRGPLERSFPSPAAIAREVRITVAHELGHHLGFEEDRLADLGLG